MESFFSLLFNLQKRYYILTLNLSNIFWNLEIVDNHRDLPSLLLHQYYTMSKEIMVDKRENGDRVLIDRWYLGKHKFLEIIYRSQFEIENHWGLIFLCISFQFMWVSVFVCGRGVWGVIPSNAQGISGYTLEAVFRDHS